MLCLVYVWAHQKIFLNNQPRNYPRAFGDFLSSVAEELRHVPLVRNQKLGLSSATPFLLLSILVYSEKTMYIDEHHIYTFESLSIIRLRWCNEHIYLTGPLRQEGQSYPHPFKHKKKRSSFLLYVPGPFRCGWGTAPATTATSAGSKHEPDRFGAFPKVPHPHHG